MAPAQPKQVPWLCSSPNSQGSLIKSVEWALEDGWLETEEGWSME